MNTKNLVSEFIGTFALIFIGAGAVAIDKGGLIGAALAHGLVVVAFVYAYGHISGTHINPAVTLGLLIAGEIEFAAAIGYWIVQFLGGILGAVLLNVVLPNPGDLGATILTEGVTPVQGLVVEIVLTFFLVSTIFNTAVSGKAGNFAGLAIGLTLIACILMGGSLDTGFSQPSADIGTCYCQRQLRRHLALFRGTVRRCNPRCTSLYRCFERQRGSVVHLPQAKEKAGTFTRQPFLFGFIGCVLRCRCNRNFGRFRYFRFRNGERQHTVTVFGFDIVCRYFRWERESPLEAAVPAFNSAVILSIVNVSLPFFAAERQEVIFDGDMEIVFCDTRQFGADFKFVVCFRNIN